MTGTHNQADFLRHNINISSSSMPSPPAPLGAPAVPVTTSPRLPPPPLLQPKLEMRPPCFVGPFVIMSRPNDSLSEASRGFVPPPSGFLLGGRNGSEGRWLPRPDQVRMLPPINRRKELLPRLSPGDYADADVVRPAMREQPPSSRSTEVTSVRARDERTGECRAGPLLEHSVAGESATKDHATVISSRPWTSTPLASPAGKASNGGGGICSNKDGMLDAGAGWGNVMDAPSAHVMATVPCGALRYRAQATKQQSPDSGPARGAVAPMVADNRAVLDSEPWPNVDVGGKDQHAPHRQRGSPAKRDSTPRAERAGDDQTPPVEYPWREAAPRPSQDMKREFGRYSPQNGKRRRAASDDSGDASPRGQGSPNASRPWASGLRRGDVGSCGSRDGRFRDGVGLWGSLAPLPKLKAPYDVACTIGAPAVGIVRAHSSTTRQSHGAGTKVASPSRWRTVLPALDVGSVPAVLGRGGWREGDGVTSGRGGSSPDLDHHYPHLDHTDHPIAGPSPGRVGRGGHGNFGVGAQPLPPVAVPTLVSYPLSLEHASMPTGQESTMLCDAGGPTGNLMVEGRTLESLTARGAAEKDEAGAGGGALRPQARRAEEQKRESIDASAAGAGSGRGCQAEDCDRRPIYSYKGSKKAAYCARHRMDGMVDTRHPLCKNEQCTRQPSFGMEGDRRATYCAEHKLAGMINVASRRCQHPGCLRHPNFGFAGDRRASYCSGHRETGMVDIVSRRCRDPSCGRRPLYNMDGLRPVCCSQHKAPGMIDVVSTRCQEPGCFCHPSFGYASDKKARRCARHRLENMEGVKGHKQKRRKESTASISAATSASTATATPSSTTTIGAPRPSTPAVSPTHTATIPPFSSFNSRNARGSVESAVRKESMGAGRDRGGVGGSRGEGGTPVGVGGSTRRVGVSGPGGMAARSAVARV